MALVLNTNVEGLLKENGQIKGVVTNSRAMPQVLGKVVIAAGGNPSRQAGITKQEGMNRPEETFWPGIIWDLVGVRDADPAALETIYGADVRRNWTTLWPRGGDRYIMVTDTVEQLEHIKKGRYLLAQKLRNAYPMWMYEYVAGNMGGQPLPKGMVRDGLILAGDAAGYEGMAHAIVSGHWAGEVAAEAIKEGNVSTERLSAYEEMCKAKLPHVNLVASIYRGGLATMAKVRELSSDEEIEREVTKLAESGEFMDGEQELPEL